LITPPNVGSGGGSCLPVMVVVALGEPGVPVICWAATGDGEGGGDQNDSGRHSHKSVFSFHFVLLLFCQFKDAVFARYFYP
jgi:hypothetical protein